MLNSETLQNNSSSTQTAPKDILTSLPNGDKVKKDDLRMIACGTIDELNSFIGLLITEVADDIQKELQHIQRILFYIGAIVVDANIQSAYNLDEEVLSLKESIRNIEQLYGGVHSFVLPGGSRPAAISHICRTICRRAERCVISADKYSVVPFLNRLSTYFFSLSIYFNKIHNTDEIKL